MAEAKNLGSLTPNCKLLRREVTLNRQMLFGRLQVLTQGQQPAAGSEDVLQRLHNLIFLLTHTEHQPGFDRDLRGESGGIRQQVQ